MHDMKQIITFTFFLLLSLSGQTQNSFKLNMLAYDQIEKGNLDSGLVYITKAIKLDSSFYVSYYNRGVINRELGKLDLAIDDFGIALRLNPSDRSSYMNRGILYFQLNDYNKAITDFKNVIKLDSTYKEAYFNIGLIKLNTKDYYQAEIAFKKCIELDSLYHTAIFRLGKTYFFSKKYDDAFKNFNLCISIYDQDPEYFELRGIIHFMKGNKTAGCKDFTRTAELGELSPPALEVQKKECK